MAARPANADDVNTDLLIYLSRHEPVVDDSGRATAKLMAPFERQGHSRNFIDKRIDELERDGLIVRDKRGRMKRTYEWALTDAGRERVQERVAEASVDRMRPRAEEASPEQVDSADTDTDDQPLPTLPQPQLATMADAILKRVGQVLAGRDKELAQARAELREVRDQQASATNRQIADLETQVRTLQRQLEEQGRETQQVRSQLGKVNEDLVRTRTERDNLRRRLESTGTAIENLISGEERAALQRMMKQVPVGAGNGSS